MSLTQIAADELAALPREMQLELVSKLPRSRNAAVERVGVDKNDDADEGQGMVSVVKEKNSSSDDVSVFLPSSFSQIDPAVLHALPFHLQRELASAFGM